MAFHNRKHFHWTLCKSIYGIHVTIISLESQWLLYLIVDVPHATHLLSPVHWDFIICIGGCANHGYHLVVC